MRGRVIAGLVALFVTLAPAAFGLAAAPHESLGIWKLEKVPWIQTATHFFVAPDGKAENKGTIDSPWDIESTMAGKHQVSPGSIVWLRAGTYGKGGTTTYYCQMHGTEQRPIIVRAYPGERATIDGGIITSRDAESWVWFWGLEVTNSSTDRTRRPGGFDLNSRGGRVINCIIHDVGHSPVGFWIEVGDGGEIHGCVLWAAGIYDMSEYWGGTPRGSGFYMQNKDGTRYVTDNISFRNFTTGMKAYTEGGYADGFHFEGNVVFDNGDWNIWGSGGTNPMRRLKAISNFSYRKPNDDQSSVQFGHGRHQDNAEIRDNYFVAGRMNAYALKVMNWDMLSISGNTFVGTLEGAAEADFPDNTYLTARPSGVNVFVRPNKYEHRRGHVVVYNWDKRPAVDVDLSAILPVDAEFEIRDAQNYFGDPVVTGVFDGRSVSIPMNLTKVAMPVGNVPHIANRFAHTAPEFAAFVVIGKQGTGKFASDLTGEILAPAIEARGGVFIRPVHVRMWIPPPSDMRLSLERQTQVGAPQGAAFETAVWTPTVSAGALGSIRYTTDGTDPGPASALYTDLITLDRTTVLKARLFLEDGRASTITTALFRIVPENKPPVCSAGSPIGRLPADTIQTKIALATDEDATCRFDTKPGTPYVKMTGAFETTDGKTHSFTGRDLEKGKVRRYYVKAMDQYGNADLDDYVITFFVGDAAVPFSQRIEAEDGKLSGPMETRNDAEAQAGKYISCDTGVPGDGRATWSFTVPATDDYVIWARTWSATANGDSFYVSVDGAEDVFDANEKGDYKKWRWSMVNGRGGESTGKPEALNPRIFTLEKGDHTLTLRGREPGARLDALIITNERDFKPAGQ